ncbi:MAG: ABC transporter substrate-binding protein [Coriobacteriales bacterium]|nr:ABC transporter substrate-binding protein [Coriobacteriales bacterium]
MSMISRRSFLAGSTLAAGGLLAACGGSQSGASTAAGQGASSGAAKVVRFGMGALGAPLDMQKNGMSVAGTLTDSVFEGLLTWTDDLELVPTLLAAMPTFEDDGVTLPCELLEGVKFHDGSSLSSADVKFTFERMFNPATGAGNYNPYLQIKGAPEMLAGKRDNLDEGIIIQDDTHFSFVLSEPSATFIPSLGIFYAHIFPHEACAAAGDAWGTGTNVVGTGKFRLVSNDDTTEAVFERFADYHGEPAALDEARIKYYDDANTKLLAFKKGDIDWCDIGFSLYGQYKDDADFAGNTYPYQPLGLQFVNLNLHDKQLADLRVRKALSLAINRQELVDTIMDGQGQAASGFLTPQIPGYDDKSEAFAYDPDQARKLIAEACPDGLKLEFRTRALFSTVAEALQGYWQEVGVQVNLQQLDNGVFMEDWAKGNLQILVNGWFADYPSGDGLLSYFEAKNAANHGCYYANDEFDALMGKARVELDETAQADLYRQADDIASRQDYAMIPLLYPHYNYAAKPYVKGHKVGNMSFHMTGIDVDTSDPAYKG